MMALLEITANEEIWNWLAETLLLSTGTEVNTPVLSWQVHVSQKGRDEDEDFGACQINDRCLESSDTLKIEILLEVP